VSLSTLVCFDNDPEPAPSRHRWHCSRCGRFVPQASVRKLPPAPGEADEHDYRGTCPTHGESVDVVWPEALR
jgi:hypothetical protein